MNRVDKGDVFGVVCLAPPSTLGAHACPRCDRYQGATSHENRADDEKYLFKMGSLLTGVECTAAYFTTWPCQPLVGALCESLALATRGPCSQPSTDTACRGTRKQPTMGRLAPKGMTQKRR